MRWRRFIYLVALLGVLMHAGMIMRHSQVMLAAHLERQDLVAALGVICHGGTQQTSAPSQGELPWVPPPSEQQNGQCPLCAGLVSALAIAGGIDLSAPTRYQVPVPHIARYEARPLAVANVRPPTRGPPV